MCAFQVRRRNDVREILTENLKFNLLKCHRQSVDDELGKRLIIHRGNKKKRNV